MKKKDEAEKQAEKIFEEMKNEMGTEGLKELTTMMTKIIALSGNLNAKIMIEWDEVSNLFRDIMDKYVRPDKNVSENKLNLMLDFFKQIKQLTQDLIKELEK